MKKGHWWSARAHRWRAWVVASAVLMIIVGGVADLMTSPQVVLFGIVAMAPVLAAVAARPWVVAAVGAFALLVAWTVSSWQGLSGTADQVLRLWMIAGTTVLSMAVARHQQVLEQRGYQAAENKSAHAAIVESSEDGIFTIDLEGTITTWNDSAARISGLTASEVLGRDVTMLVMPELAKIVPSLLARLAAGERVSVLDTRRVRKDGTFYDVSTSVSPVRGQDGAVVGSAIISRDITAQKHLLERSAGAERLESLGQLAGGIAHDFNNLLAIILNYVDFALEHATDPDLRNDLLRARDGGERARNLTRQLLLFARQESANAELIDLNAVIGETRALLERTIGAHIDLLAHTAERPLTVRADRSRLEQILLNLVINARDAMPGGGMIVMAAGAVDLPDDPDRRPPLAAGSYAQLQVTDTGSGMSPEIAARIFEPFFSTKAKQHGTGLGLATVYGIVTEAGGTVTVTSEPGAGTTFHILLPLADTEEPAPAGTSAPLPRGDGRHILLAEDDIEVRRVASRILERHGYRVATAGHGRAALDQLGRAPFDLLITDVIMPEMSGLELIDEVRRWYPAMPVLLVSGYAEDIAKVHRLRAEGVPMIHKPFTARELLHAVHQAATDARSTPAHP
ncbi:response regulator [Actinoplanes sp. NPDC049668]|uniref:hybrid sensor histidine kinase/response regulator n=1 Tax=unclassified Actinoplanes TaxID=2626549 RepID=UPI0033AB10EA